MGLGICEETDGDSVKGYMTAKEVIQQLKKFCKQHRAKGSKNGHHRESPVV